MNGQTSLVAKRRERFLLLQGIKKSFMDEMVLSLALRMARFSMARVGRVGHPR